MKPLAAPAVWLALALLTFFGFPGHTWLQQDTQIYVPLMEHQRDPTALRNDLLVQYPHLAFTLYDEVTRALRAVTRQDFRDVLGAQQIVTRALGIWGFYLMALALGLGAWPSWIVAALCALGTTITGPQVLSFEYEPTPRAFAVPLLFCAIGLAAHRRYTAAAIAGAAAFLYHPPTALPVLVLLAIAAYRKPAAWLFTFAVAAAILGLAAHGEPGQAVFGSLTPLQEQLQRMRAPYAWISTWHPIWIGNFLLLAIVGGVAYTRLKLSRELKIFLVALPLLGLLTMPVSYVLLEHWKWVLMPQIQPLRMLLFVAVAAQFLTAAAGVRAIISKRLVEAAACFAVAYLIAVQPVLADPHAWLPLWPPLRPAYPALHTPALAQLSDWANTSTPQDAVFLFPDAGHNLAPGIFRAKALRAVFVDWKSGGQVNYSKAFAEQWWTRYQLTMTGPINVPKYQAFGIAYIVVKPEHRLPRPAVYENTSYLVYSTIP
jgi:hypothetical protein